MANMIASTFRPDNFRKPKTEYYKINLTFNRFYPQIDILMVTFPSNNQNLHHIDSCFSPFIEIDLDELNRSDIFYETESSSESVLNTSQQLLQRRAVNLNATNNNECSTARENVSHTKSSEAEHNNNQTPGKRSRTKSVHDHDCIGCAISPECSTQKRLKKRSPAKSPRRSKKCK